MAQQADIDRAFNRVIKTRFIRERGLMDSHADANQMRKEDSQYDIA